MATTNYNIRIDQNLRDRAFSVFESYGLAPAQAIKLFLNQVADTRTIPLSFTHNADKIDDRPKIPNATTLAAIQEAKEERKTAKTYASFEEAMRHLEEK
ncbi:type II toxin-antitoxin system RelB/DinJ family antitoxin [Glaesserella sp.]|uniref:type II toxin-antitoxin system RelB/DinJ family antitoxin n=1 Tax=Glaesserella sp. TaxID=2094731 RepID=UPI0035A0BF5F